MVPLEPIDAVNPEKCIICNAFVFVVMAIRVFFYSSVTYVFVLDLYCASLMVRSIVLYCFAKICIYIDLWEL